MTINIENVKIRINVRKGTATIKMPDGTVYREEYLTRDDINDFETMTMNDFQNHLRTSGNYYRVR